MSEHKLRISVSVFLFLFTFLISHSHRTHTRTHVLYDDSTTHQQHPRTTSVFRFCLCSLLSQLTMTMAMATHSPLPPLPALALVWTEGVTLLTWTISISSTQDRDNSLPWTSRSGVRLGHRPYHQAGPKTIGSLILPNLALSGTYTPKTKIEDETLRVASLPGLALSSGHTYTWSTSAHRDILELEAGGRV